MERKHWLDLLRGIAIIMVVIVHQIDHNIYWNVYTGHIMMPLFFAISGYLFNNNNNIRCFLIKITKNLVIPWLALGVIVTIPQILDGYDDFSAKIIGLFTGKELWFMPCLIFGEIILYVLLKIRHKWLFISAALLVSITGLKLGQLGILDFLRINRAMCVQIFFLIGIIFREYESYFVKINVKYILLASILYFTIATGFVLTHPVLSIDVHLNHYSHFPFNCFLIILGCFICFCIASKYKFSSRILTVIGQNSLVIYIFNGLFIAAVCRIFQKQGINFIDNIWILAIIKTIYGCTICTILSLILNKYTPILIGKGKRINN